MSKKQTEDNPDLSKKQDIPVIITPFYPFRQGQKNACNGIAVPRREWDEYQGLIINPKHKILNKKENERFEQLNYKWAYKGDPLTGQEIRLIEQTIGSVYMSEIRAFFIDRYQYTPDKLNDLTWYDILDILRGFRALRSKNMRAVLPQGELSMPMQVKTAAKLMGMSYKRFRKWAEKTEAVKKTHRGLIQIRLSKVGETLAALFRTVK
jgi:hypothetical protein